MNESGVINQVKDGWKEAPYDEQIWNGILRLSGSSLMNSDGLVRKKPASPPFNFLQWFECFSLLSQPCAVLTLLLTNRKDLSLENRDSDNGDVTLNSGVDILLSIVYAVCMACIALPRYSSNI